MDITSDRKEKVLFVLPDEARIDGSNAQDFDTALAEAITDNDNTVIMDLSNLNYISSAGLRVILLIAKMLHLRDATLMLCSLKSAVQGCFEISGFDKIIAIHDNRKKAMDALGKKY